MKKIITTTLAVMAALACSAQTIPLVVGEWAPFTGEKLADQGVCTEIVKAAAKAGGLNVEITFCPWARCENSVKDGSAFATFPYASTEARRGQFDFSDPILLTKSKIYYYEGVGKSIDWASIKDLQSYKFGGVNGYWYVEDLQKNGITPMLSSSSDIAFKMLQAGRFDYLIENELVAAETIKTTFAGDAKIKAMDKPYDESSYYLMVSKTYPNSAEILKKFQAGLDAIHKDGSYQAIIAKLNAGK